MQILWEHNEGSYKWVGLTWICPYMKLSRKWKLALWAFSINIFLSVDAVAIADYGGIDSSVLCEISSGMVYM